MATITRLVLGIISLSSLRMKVVPLTHDTDLSDPGKNELDYNFLKLFI